VGREESLKTGKHKVMFVKVRNKRARRASAARTWRTVPARTLGTARSSPLTAPPFPNMVVHREHMAEVGWAAIAPIHRTERRQEVIKTQPKSDKFIQNKER
jgi:hypothetical protein